MRRYQERDPNFENNEYDGAMNKIYKPSNRGQELVEFSLTLPILLLLVMMIVDMSRAAYFYSVVFNSAREGARYGAAVVDAPAADIIAAAERLAGGLDVNVSLSETEDNLQVEVSYTFTPATPIIWNLMGNGSIQLKSKASMQLEE